MQLSKSYKSTNSVDYSSHSKENLQVRSQVRGLFQKTYKPVLTQVSRPQPPMPQEFPILHSLSDINGSFESSQGGHFEDLSKLDSQMLFSEKEISSI